MAKTVVPTRAQMVDSLVEAMNDWTLEELLGWAQEARRGMLDNISDDAVALEYQQECSHLEDDDG